MPRLACSAATLAVVALAAAAVAALPAAATAARPPVAAPASALAWDKAPWFCHDLDCPQFEVVENLTAIGVELRRYAPSTWVETTVEMPTSVAGAIGGGGMMAAAAAAQGGPLAGAGGGFGGPPALGGDPSANGGTGYERAVAVGFYKLFKYISGENLTGTKLAMTAPVRVVVTPGQGPACADKFSIAFFVPPSVKTPPPPSDASVSITTTPEATYYVNGFGGWATGATYADRARSVAAALEGAGRDIDDTYFGTAGYDSPFTLRNRHNEVWLPTAAKAAAAKAGKPVVAAAAAAAAAAKPAPAAKSPPAAALKLPTGAANN